MRHSKRTERMKNNIPNEDLIRQGTLLAKVIRLGNVTTLNLYKIIRFGRYNNTLYSLNIAKYT
jgi:hypothetical protein